MCVQNFSYFNGNFLPGVFPGPQVFVAIAADIPEARKAPDSINKPSSVHYTNELQCSKFNIGIRRVAIGSRNRTPVYSGDQKRCDGIRCDATRFSVHSTCNSSLRDSMRLDATRYVYCEPALSEYATCIPAMPGNIGYYI